MNWSVETLTPILGPKTQGVAVAQLVKFNRHHKAERWSSFKWIDNAHTQGVFTDENLADYTLSLIGFSHQWHPSFYQLLKKQKHTIHTDKIISQLVSTSLTRMDTTPLSPSELKPIVQNTPLSNGLRLRLLKQIEKEE